MKVINLNVNFSSRKIPLVVEYIFSLEPDVVCFQEFPKKYLSLLDQYKYLYEYRYTNDAFSLKDPQKAMLILTLVSRRYRILSSQILTYFDKPHTSLLDKFYYRKICQMNEEDKAIVVEIPGIDIVNFRLSAATGARNKHLMLHNILDSVKNDNQKILCGDFNTSSKFIFRLLTGPLRNYSLKDYFCSEGEDINKLISDYGYVNNFINLNTMDLPFFPRMQLDYILTDRDQKINDKILEGGLGSDHKMLMITTA